MSFSQQITEDSSILSAMNLRLAGASELRRTFFVCGSSP